MKESASHKAGHPRLRPLLAGGMIGSLLTLLIFASSRQPVAAVTLSSPVLPGVCSESDRFGLATTGGQILQYDVGKLHAGWYHNFTIVGGAPRPADMTYVQTIRTSDDGPFADRACSSCPAWTDLDNMVRASPGAVWFIGNEPDAPLQDNVTPWRYADIYHELYSFLKEHDPSCLVGIGGVVQPTPVRLLYLGLILDAYSNAYTETMPIDVWNTHNYLLREKANYADCPDCWGTGIPPGITATYGITVGILYDIQDSDRLDPCVPQQPPDPDDPHCVDKIGWKQQILNLRQFMAKHGYQNTPLVLSEYGILMPVDYYTPPFDWNRVGAFMLATFDWLVTATDESIGYPEDGNHLVQAWGWYPFDTDTFGHNPPLPGNAHLFDPALHSLTPLGSAFGDYAKPLTAPYPGTVDLRVVSVADGPPIPNANGLMDVTITADIQNAGASASGSFVVGFERDGVPVDEITVPDLSPGGMDAVSVTWSVHLGDAWDVRVQALPDAPVIDCDPYNNAMTAHVWVTEFAKYLPVVGKTAHH